MDGKVIWIKRSANIYVLFYDSNSGRYSLANKEKLDNRWTNYILWYPGVLSHLLLQVVLLTKREWEKQNSSFGMLIDRVQFIIPIDNVRDNLRNEVWLGLNLL